MRNILGIEFVYDLDSTYELTADNVKKMLAIYMRFRFFMIFLTASIILTDWLNEGTDTFEPRYVSGFSQLIIVFDVFLSWSKISS